MSPETARVWVYASLSLVQPGWPGVTPATWVACMAGGEQFRCVDALDGMNRLGGAGWELVSFSPEVGDRSSCFYFKARNPAEPAPD
jgi:hypothetical protein